MHSQSETLDEAYNQIVVAIDAGAEQASSSPPTLTAEKLGLKLLEDGHPRQTYTYARVEGNKRVIFTWRWYDQSKTFSIRPDRNIIAVALEIDGKATKSYTRDFED